MTTAPRPERTHRRLLLDTWLAEDGILSKVSGLWFAEVVTLVVVFLQTIFVARWLGPRQYGIAAVTVGYCSVAVTIVDARSWHATVKYLGQFEAQREPHRALAVTKLAYLIDAALSVLAFLGVVISAAWAERHVVHAPGTAWLLTIHAAAFVVASPSGTSWAVLATMGSFKLLAALRSAAAVVRAGLIVGLVGIGMGFRGFILGSALATALEGLTLGVIGFRVAKRRWERASPATFWSDLKGHRREILGFLAWNDLGALTGLLISKLDIMLLGYLRGPRDVGFYRVARSLASVGSSVGVPLQSVVSPQLARLWGDRDEARLRHTVWRYALGVGLPLSSLAFGCILAVPLVIRVAVGDAYDPAVPAGRLLVAAAAIWLGFFWLRPLYQTLGAVRTWTLLLTVAGAASFVGFVIVVPRFGFVGMAWVSFFMGAGFQVTAFLLLFARPWRSVENDVEDLAPPKDEASGG